MRRIWAALGLALALLAPVAHSAIFSEGGRRAVMMGGGIKPVASFNATTDPFPSAILSHSRTSLATMFDSTGKLTYAPNNILTQSNTFSDAAWTLSTATLSSGVSDPLGGTNAWTLTATGAGALLYQNVTIPTTANGLFAVYVKRRTGSGTISLRQPAGAYSAVTVTGSWTQISVVGPGNGAVNIAIQIATSGDAIDIYAATVSAVTYETTPRTADQVITTSAAYYGPRIDYDPNTLAVKGLLIEEARTNLNIQSGPLTTSWTAAGVTRTADAATASDGTLLASKFTATAGTNPIQFYAPAVSVTAGNYTNSIEIDGSSGAFPVLVFLAGTVSASAVFDVTTNADGVATQSGTTGAGISIISTKQTYLGNGRYRVSLTAALPAAGTYCYYGMTPNKTGNTFMAGSGLVNATWAGTEYINASMSQFEAGSFATSYIPTAAASVTRAADVVQFTGAALTALQGSAGSAIVEMTDQSVGYSATGGVVLGGSSTYWLDLANGNMYSNSGSHFLNTANAAVAGSPYRASVAWNASGRSLAMNGGTVATDAFGGWAATTPYLGSLSGTANFANGHVASLAIYNQRLPDATLQTKSVVGASYAANDNGVRFAFANDNLPIHWRVAL